MSAYYLKALACCNYSDCKYKKCLLPSPCLSPCGLDTAHLGRRLRRYSKCVAPLQNTNEHKCNGVGVGAEDEIMFRLCHVSASIFPGLTDRPINLIYHVSPHPLTSSTGLFPNNELLRMGTIGVLVSIAFVLQLLR